MKFYATAQPRLFGDDCGFKPLTYLPSEMEQGAKNLKDLPVCFEHDFPLATDNPETVKRKVLGRVSDAFVSYEYYDEATGGVLTSTEGQRIMIEIELYDDSNPWAKEIANDINNNVLKGVSLGIMHTRYTDDGEQVIDIDKKPMEVSVVKEGDIPYSSIYHPALFENDNSTRTVENPDIYVHEPAANESWQQNQNMQMLTTMASKCAKISCNLIFSMSSANWKALIKPKSMSTQTPNPIPEGNQPPSSNQEQPDPSVKNNSTPDEEDRFAKLQKQIDALIKQNQKSEEEKKKAEDELEATKLFDEHRDVFKRAEDAIASIQSQYDPASSQFANLGKRKEYWAGMEKNKHELLVKEDRDHILAEANIAIDMVPPAPKTVTPPATGNLIPTKASGKDSEIGQMSKMERSNMEMQQKQAGRFAAQAEKNDSSHAWKRRLYGDNAPTGS